MYETRGETLAKRTSCALYNLLATNESNRIEMILDVWKRRVRAL
jgi:hypothetical protein